MYYFCIKMSMNFITTTEIARNGSKSFKTRDYSLVLNNNKNIWLIIWEELWKALLESWVMDQLREELWETHDKETTTLIKKSKSWDRTDSIGLEDYRKKYGV